MSELRIATCTYQEFQPEMGTPIRTTAGHPRFALSYQIAGHAKLVTPAWALVKANLPEDAYEFQYRRQLSAAGLDAIRAELYAIAGAYDLDSPAVLLCFDRLNKPGYFCHRTHFARWYAAETGELVPELGAVCAPKPWDQGGLF
ncbi:hypothetical protein ACFWAP_33575 [Streptomyces goshikiensis]|uniref:hypothetical protein n=1 Tax=Streptomyces goshikiensis TaxID=1942 RepID=UPI00365E4638